MRLGWPGTGRQNRSWTRSCSAGSLAPGRWSVAGLLDFRLITRHRRPANLLGRLLEEIAAKTKARVLILDPNSDFGQFGAVAEEAWKFEEGDSREAFERRWRKVGFSLVTLRS
jgi:hypothetical protein